MNYQACYDRLIARAQNRDRPTGYCEKHHIVPKCLGGGDELDNLVTLTAREHFVAHHLLYKISGDSNLRLCLAFILMSGRFNIKSRTFERERLKLSNSMIGDLNVSKLPEIRLKMSNWQKNNSIWKGVKRPDHSLKMKGSLNPRFGKTTHAQGLVEYAKIRQGQSLSDLYGSEKSEQIRLKMKNARAGEAPKTGLILFNCHVCGREIKGSGNVSQHLKSAHEEVYKNHLEKYNWR